MAPSTARQYDVALKIFTEFRFLFGIEDIWPVPLQDIIGFIAHMFKKGFSYSTVNCYISGLSFYNQINNYEDHTQMFIVRKMIDVPLLKRMLGFPLHGIFFVGFWVYFKVYAAIFMSLIYSKLHSVWHFLASLVLGD